MRAGAKNSSARSVKVVSPFGEEDDDDFGDILTCVGYPVSISEGESCAVTGDYTTHPVYGEQLRVQSYRPIVPEGAQAMYRYLAAGSIKGLGPATAAKIVRKFGDESACGSPGRSVLRWRTKRTFATL